MSKQIWMGTNWKMNMSPDSAKVWAEHVGKYAKAHQGVLNLFVMPPFPLIPLLQTELKGSAVLVGAQNCHWEESGPFTGETSAQLLAQTNVDMVLLGHAERRAQFNESDEIIHRKLQAVVNHGMRAVLCIGEDKSVKGNQTATEKLLRQQLETAVHHLQPSYSQQIIVAYEPVWAIGNQGVEPRNEDIKSNLQFIKDVANDILENDVPVIYGGSVTSENCRDLMTLPSIDGLFVGRHALDGKTFVKIMGLAVSEGVESI
ncbi:triose-phosphate isomerase [Alicyclobacillus sp. SO9]|uniref:triose-phosphate isomerase n=1 Tax=Alicyclobacillus sp. SO9 TaxID=2665646 RepID=UPI0018E70CD5|nr:triose-phosphate isomerase [Alicyclobacillus sp. SO9]QQE77983.1 triose-phosphate isomerase [Alicyclobacillus sp. SO9]